MGQGVSNFEDRLSRLRAELAEQGRRVARVIELAVEAVFEKDEAKAGEAIRSDEEIDRIDVRIEKQAVQLMIDVLAADAPMDEHDVRMLFTIVKVNNEFERIADLAVLIAERVDSFVALSSPPPPKFRVMANSVIGIMRSCAEAFGRMDIDAARMVLATDDATEAFKTAILRDVEEQLVAGEYTVDYAFALSAVAYSLGRMADHCTNVAEQMIYVGTGKIVRHMGDHWTEPTDPGV